MKNWKIMTTAAAVAAASLVSVGVLAFPTADEWHDSADGILCGAGDIVATGSIQDWGVTCAHCHTDDAKQQGKIGVKLTPTPAFPKKNGVDAYVPGTTYQITVDLLNEHLGLNLPMDNANGMALSIEDQAGKTQGVFTSDGNPKTSSANCVANPTMLPDGAIMGTTTIRGDCHAITSLNKVGLASWKFTWKAPSAGAGQLVVYYGVVDADYSTGGATRSSLGDDVKVGTLKLVEDP